MLRFGAFDNSFSGTISTELGLMSSVSAFELNFNQLSGAIPSELGSLPNLTHFVVNGNLLTGTLSSEILGLRGPDTRLQAFSVADNPLAEAYSEDDACWVNSTFYNGECHHRTLFAMTCICSCACPMVITHAGW